MIGPAKTTGAVAFVRDAVDLLRSMSARTVVYDRTRASLAAWCMPEGWSCAHLLPAGHCGVHTAWFVSNALGLDLRIYRSRR